MIIVKPVLQVGLYASKGPSCAWLTADTPETPPGGAVAINDEAGLAAMALDGIYYLSGDIALTAPWTPKGSLATPFTGALYGCGHAITGIDITSAADHVGLFGATDGATLVDLTLVGTISSTHQQTGLLCGLVLGGRVKNIEGLCSITSSAVVTGCLIGTCSNGADISKLKAYGSITGGGEVGGVIGLNSRCSPSDLFAAVRIDCNGANYNGGIIGVSNIGSDTISRTLSFSRFSGAGSRGGTCGSVAATMVDCYYSSDCAEFATTDRGTPLDDDEIEEDSYYDGWTEWTKQAITKTDDILIPATATFCGGSSVTIRMHEGHNGEGYLHDKWSARVRQVMINESGVTKSNWQKLYGETGVIVWKLFPAAAGTRFYIEMRGGIDPDYTVSFPGGICYNIDIPTIDPNVHSGGIIQCLML